MSDCECLCVIVISCIGAGGKAKYEEIRPYGRKTRLPGVYFTPLQKQQKPGGLDFSRLPGFYGQKEKPRRLYQILRGYVCLHQYIDTSYDCWLESFRGCMGCVYASPVNTPQSVAKSLYSSVIDSIFFLKESRSLKGDLCVRAF